MTLLIPGTGPAHDPGRPHLFIVLNDPCVNQSNLLVPLNSAHPKCDRTCVLTSGHEFIRRESFANYAMADTVAADVLRQAVAEGKVAYRGLFAENEFVSIRAGVLTSPHTRPRVKAYFRNFCL